MTTRFRRAVLSSLVLLTLGAGGAAHAGDVAASGVAASGVVTDANIVTGLDISASIDAGAMRAQIVGMATAIGSPEVVAAIRSGYHGRIGFTVFAWHHGQFPTVVSWSVIASQEDARAAADAVAARLDVKVEEEAHRSVKNYIGRLTNLSQAIDHAAVLVGAAPFPTDRAVVNIIGNGTDNVGEGPAIARDRFVEAGGTVNGVVLGPDPGLLEYYREHVIGGPGAFVLSTADADGILDVMRRKLVVEIARLDPASPDLTR